MELSLEGVAIGALAIAIGLALVLRGFRLFMLLLPAIGFLAGFLLGAELIERIFGDAFLATLLGWVGGFVLGLIFAALSYLYYLAAVGLFGGFIGYQLTVGLLAWIGFDESGFISVMLGLIVALIVGVAFLLVRMPTVLAIVGTAIVGAGATVAGIVVGLGLVPHEQLRDGIFGVYSSEELGWLGVVVLVGLALGGMVYQARSMTDSDHIISPESFRNPGMGDGGGPAPA